MVSKISKLEFLPKDLAMSLFILVILLAFNYPLPKSFCKPAVKVFIYGFVEDSSLTDFYYDYFTQKFGTESVTIRDISNTRYKEEFLNTCIRLIASGVQVLPSGPSFCTACELSHSSFEDLMIRSAYPATLIFVDGRLIAIFFSSVETKKLDEIFENPNQEGLLIITNEKSQFSNDEKLRSYLENMILPVEYEEKAKAGDDLLKVLIPVLSLALVDSVNPCTFVLFTALLLMVHMTFGRKMRTLQAGLMFSVAVFVGYYLLGIGFVNLMGYSAILKLLVVAVGMSMSLLSITLGLKGGAKCPMPGPLKELLMGNLFERSHFSLIATCILGLLSSFTLLPCSSGPYLVGITYMQALEDPNATYALLAIYNLVFIMPLVAISLSVYFLEDAFDRIDSFKRKNLALIELVGGVILGTICVYLLLELLAEFGVLSF